MLKQLLVLGVALLGFSAAEKVRAKGVLLCGRETVADARVRLYDDNTGRRDTKMDEVVSNSRGEFEVQGEASDLISSIDPYVEVTHKCNYGRAYGKGGQRKTEVYIPSNYLDKGVADIGELNLEVRYREDENSKRFFFI